MPPASNQLFTWNDVVAEVAAKRMAWSGAPLSGNSPMTWSSFVANVLTNGTNPQGYPSNKCPTYADALAVCITIQPPTSVIASDAGAGECDVSWTAPSSGLSPDSYDYQFNTDAGFTNALGTVASKTGYINNQNANCQVRTVHGAYKSAWALSNTITMHVTGA